MRLLFVCLGNICRSPAADGIFRSMAARAGLADKFTVDSAGTYGGHRGELPDKRMRAAGLERGYVFDHISRRFTRDDFENFDMIFVMDDSNYDALRRLANTQADLDKVYRMVEYSSDPDLHYIPDPYYEGHEGFFKVIAMLEDCTKNLLGQLKERGL